MAQAALRSAYLGAAIFAGAAVVATLLALWHVKYLEKLVQSFEGWLTLLVFCLAAVLATTLSFALFNWIEWRLTRGPLVLRALLFGPFVTVVSHLIYGFFYLPLFEALPGAGLNLGWRGTFEFAVIFGFQTLPYSIQITLPVGIVAALLFECLERRLASHTGDQAKAAE